MNGFNSTTRCGVLLAMVLALLTCACRNFEVNDDRPSSGFKLPQLQMENDSVAMRVAVVEFDDHQQEEFESFVNVTDQKLSLETRRRLDQNGFRVSVVSNTNSRQLQKLLAPRILKREWLTKNERELAAAGKLDPVVRVSSQQRVEKNRGEPFQIEVSPVREQSTWTVHAADGVVSDRAALAQCEMQISAWPQPDGSVRLQFIPEIHHGQSLSQIGVEGQDLALRQSRQIEELRSLAFEVQLQPGETVMVAPTATLDRVGGLFFGTGEISNDMLVAGTSIEEVADDVDASEFFPMLAEGGFSEPDDSVGMLLTGDDLVGELRTKSQQRPRPWQRAMLVRVVEVTPPAIP